MLLKLAAAHFAAFVRHNHKNAHARTDFRERGVTKETSAGNRYSPVVIRESPSDHRDPAEKDRATSHQTPYAMEPPDSPFSLLPEPLILEYRTYHTQVNCLLSLCSHCSLFELVLKAISRTLRTENFRLLADCFIVGLAVSHCCCCPTQGQLRRLPRIPKFSKPWQALDTRGLPTLLSAVRPGNTHKTHPSFI